LFIGKKSPAALFSDIGFVAGGKKRGFCRLLLRVATPGPGIAGQTSRSFIQLRLQLGEALFDAVAASQVL
jgi:hypothetical protein